MAERPRARRTDDDLPLFGSLHRATKRGSSRPTTGGSPSAGKPVPAPDPLVRGIDRLLLTVPEVAKLLHIGRRQAWEMVWRKEVPVVRLGRSVRIARVVLERFVVEHSRPYGA